MRLIWHPNTGVYLCESVWCWICTYYLVKEECSTEVGSIDVIGYRKVYWSGTMQVHWYFYFHASFNCHGGVFIYQDLEGKICMYTFVYMY